MKRVRQNGRHVRCALWISATLCVASCHRGPAALWQLDGGPPHPTQAGTGTGIVAVGHAAGVTLLTPDGSQLCSAMGVGPVVAPPRVEGAKVYVASTNHVLYALDNKCQTLWRHPLGGPLRTPPVVSGEMVVAGAPDGHLSGLDAATGVSRWVYPPRPPPPAPPPPVNTIVVDANGAIPGADVPATDAPPPEPPPAAQPQAMSAFPQAAQQGAALPPQSFATAGLATSDALGFAGNDDRFLYVLEAATGKLAWAWEATAAITGTPQVGVDAVFFTTADGAVAAVGRENHNLVWKLALSKTPCRGLSLTPAALLAACDDHHLYAVDRAAGTVRFKHRFAGPLMDPPLMHGDAVLMANGAGSAEILAVPFGPGEPLWRASPPASPEAAPPADGVSSLTIVANTLMVGTPGGQLFGVPLPEFTAAP